MNANRFRMGRLLGSRPTDCPVRIALIPSRADGCPERMAGGGANDLDSPPTRQRRMIVGRVCKPRMAPDSRPGGSQAGPANAVMKPSRLASTFRRPPDRPRPGTGLLSVKFVFRSPGLDPPARRYRGAP